MNNELELNSRLARVGHRSYVGGRDAERWYSIGKLQYHFLIAHGLGHHHNFLDIACGSLRLGQFLIPYLDRGKYFGLEALPALVDRGIEQEFFHDIIQLKAPRFSFNDDFNFSFCPGFDYAIAQSLVTHLEPDAIKKLFTELAQHANDRSRFFFTFFEGLSANNKGNSDPHLDFHYSFPELREMAGLWNLTYIGDWNHPVGQKMVLAELR